MVSQETLGLRRTHSTRPTPGAEFTAPAPSPVGVVASVWPGVTRPMGGGRELSVATGVCSGHSPGVDGAAVWVPADVWVLLCPLRGLPVLSGSRPLLDVTRKALSPSEMRFLWPRSSSPNSACVVRGCDRPGRSDQL